MDGSPLCRLAGLGQAPWLDDITRGMIADGSLQRLIEEDCLAGVTSNPVIFRNAIEGSDDYEPAIAALARAGAGPTAIYEALALEDVRAAADMLRPRYESSGRRDGYVCLEVSPHLARDTEGTVAEARRLWAALARPNVMVKVPGTAEALRAIRRLAAEGININVTLLFSPRRHTAVAEAHLAGLEERAAAGHAGAALPVGVASFFLSRIDALIDALLDRIESAEAREARGASAIACARLAYAQYRSVTGSKRWSDVAARGAIPQRLLWASTGTKDPAYPDVKYVEALVATDTIVTMPGGTLAAFRDHGRVGAPLGGESGDAERVMDRLAGLGIDFEEIASQLEREGIEKFAVALDDLLGALAAAGRKAGH